MRQRSFFGHLAHEHRDRAPDRLIDVNNKDFVAIPDKNRATAAGREHSTNMYLNDRFVHRVDGTDGRTKNKPLPAAAPSDRRIHMPHHTAPWPAKRYLNKYHRNGQRSAAGFS